MLKMLILTFISFVLAASLAYSQETPPELTPVDSLEDPPELTQIVPLVTPYPYPYNNPDTASLSAAIMKSKTKKMFDKIEIMDVPSLSGRNDVKFVEDRGNFKFGFYPQKKAAPLVFIIADMAGSYVSGYMMYEADLLHQNGYNVITISSPFFWNFIISSSKTALPGVTDEDAVDMYTVMQLALAKVKSKHKAPITKIGLMGIGFGGLLAAHISALEQQQNKLDIKRYLLINPVVNVLHAITEIETRAALSLDMDKHRINWMVVKAAEFVMKNMESEYRVNDSDYFLNLEKKFPLTDTEYKFLTGAALRMNIGDVIYASQLVNDLGVLKSKISRFRKAARHDEVEKMGFVGYMRNLLIPYFSKKYPKLIDLIKHANFNYVRKEVMQNQNIYLMHNADDFLVTPDQLTYLKNTFGPERSQIYPLGGHLGNMWFPDNQNHVLKVMSVLK
ncbi:MAG: alpha/beta hydrolase fold domain-containing protein [Bdellovibrionota bacterium]